jgi:WD40 repeat protein
MRCDTGGEVTLLFEITSTDLDNLRLDRDEQRLLVSGDTYIPVYSYPDGAQLHDFYLATVVRHAEFHPTAELILAATDRGPAFCDLVTGDFQFLDESRTPVWNIAVSGNGRWIATIGPSGIVLWDQQGNKSQTIAVVTDRRQRALAFSEDGVELLAATESGVASFREDAARFVLSMQHDLPRGAYDSAIYSPHQNGFLVANEFNVYLIPENQEPQLLFDSRAAFYLDYLTLGWPNPGGMDLNADGIFDAADDITGAAPQGQQ